MTTAARAENPPPGPTPYGRQDPTWTARSAHVPHAIAIPAGNPDRQGQEQAHQRDSKGPSILGVGGVFCPHTRIAWGLREAAASARPPMGTAAPLGLGQGP